MAHVPSGPNSRRSARSSEPSSLRRSSLLRILAVILSLLGVAAVVYYVLPFDDSEPDGVIAGHWLLDEDTRAWMERTCIDLAFADTTEAAVFVDLENAQAIVQFNDEKRTRLVGMHGRRQISVRQFIQTSEAGRFCGGQTTLDISWRVVNDRPDELVGRWATPGCEVCPARLFRALRSEGGSL